MISSTPPAASPTASPSGRTSSPRTPLSLDLSNLPPLSTPAPPSNTLLITNLESLAIFHPASLATIRQYISTLVPDQLHSFAPLRSLRRIVCSFYTIEAATKVRQELDGTTFLGANSSVQDTSSEGTDGEQRPQISPRDHEVRARIYFGENTPLDNTKQYLDKPDTGKLFFISPPPSPPVGWVSRREEAPNTDTHANDLQSALEKLGSKIGRGTFIDEKTDEPTELEEKTNNAALGFGSEESLPGYSNLNQSIGRTRSGSTTIIYDPAAHATDHGKDLPAVMVEDTSDLDDESPTEGKKILAHTARPPVALMGLS